MAEIILAKMPGDPRPPGELIKEKWVYREIKWCPVRVWNRVLHAMGGETCYKVLAMTKDRPTGRIRGQLLVSFEGMQNLIADSKRLRAQRDKIEAIHAKNAKLKDKISPKNKKQKLRKIRALQPDDTPL